MLPSIAWRMHTATMLAWALLIAGWLGLGRLAQAADPSPTTVSAWLALWVLALGASTTALRRWCPAHAMRCRLLALAAFAVAGAVGSAAWRPAGSAPWLLPLTLAWAALVALAFGIACDRASVRAMPLAAALGALLAWVSLGDPVDPRELSLRMAVLGIAAAALLAACRLRSGTRPVTPLPGCVEAFAGLGKPGAARQWPLHLASLSMLPTMLGLPWWGVLCSGDASSANQMLALHAASMFIPALLLGRRPGLAVHAPHACAGLLSAGALALLLAPRATAAWAVTLTHGTAWSVAWFATALQARSAVKPPRWQGAIFAALATGAFGMVVGVIGMRAFSDAHLALGLLAGFWLVGRLLMQPRPGSGRGRLATQPTPARRC